MEEEHSSPALSQGVTDDSSLDGEDREADEDLLAVEASAEPATGPPPAEGGHHEEGSGRPSAEVIHSAEADLLSAESSKLVSGADSGMSVPVSAAGSAGAVTSPDSATPGKGDGISTASIAGSLTALLLSDNTPKARSSTSLPVATDSPSRDGKVRSVQSKASSAANQTPVLSGNEWDRTGDRFLLTNNQLSEVDAQVVYALLDEYNQQLEVLGKIISAPYIKDYADEKETLRQRFRRQEDEPIQIQSTRGDHIVPANPSLVQIQQDRAYLSKAIDRLMKELRRENSYEPLIEAVEAEGTRRHEFVLIEEDAIVNSQQIAELRAEIRELKASMTEEIADRNDRILELRDELQEVLARTGMEVRYTEASMQARMASTEGQLECRRVEKRYQAEHARAQCDYEIRVNTEIESHLRDALDELNDMLDQRLTKFDVDTDAKERELSNLKYQKQQNFQALCDVKEKFAEYTRVVAEDDEELRLEEERIEEEMRRESAAIVIQSYWKGYKERKKMKKKLKKLKKAAKKAKKDAKGGKGGGKSPPKGKKKK